MLRRRPRLRTGAMFRRSIMTCRRVDKEICGMKIHVERVPGSDVARVVGCQQEGEINTLKREMGSINKALFIGNGRPAIVSQVATNSQAIGALTRLAWVTLTAVVGEAVLLVFRLFMGGASSGVQERALAELASEVKALNRAVSVRGAYEKGGQQ